MSLCLRKQTFATEGSTGSTRWPMVQLIRKLKASRIGLLAQDGGWSDNRRSPAPSPEEESKLAALEMSASPSETGRWLLSHVR